MFTKYKSYPIKPKQVVFSDGTQPRGRFIYPTAHGQCFYCGTKLTGRKRHYCSKKCKNNYYYAFSWDWLRTVILRRDKHQCVLCGSKDNLQVDHIVAIMNGGDYFDQKNLQTLCRKCHGVKTSQDYKTNKRNKLMPLSRFI